MIEFTTRCREDGFHNALIACAATDVTRKGIPHCRFIGSRCRSQKLDDGHQQAAGAKAALKSVVGREGALQRMQSLLIGRETFHRLYQFTVRLDCKHKARPDTLAIHQNGTRAAYAMFAPNVGSSQSELMPKEIGECEPRLDVSRMSYAIHCYGYGETLDLHCTLLR
ncbi:hypothetical protein ACVIIW_007309 [Bradyrhizobium sp. USDA 4449]